MAIDPAEALRPKREVPHTGIVMEIRPNCECCNKDLPPEASDAMICTFECTWCTSCVRDCLNGVCPNCGGDMQPRPIRPPSALAKFPASAERVLQPGLHKLV
ncbi:DUF1272 domain-containing protein [Dermacoccus nishinomiyaensis]|uniref:DUF1272 domain-containing protein n=1 Tax=Dermacoccus nishinomiyaensis TaxID=1274 RepID=UPI0030B8F200